MSKHPLRIRQQGLSLVEILVGLAVTGILLGQALPGLLHQVQRQRMHGVAESLRSDFQQARLHAMGTGQSVRIGFDQTAQGSCYVVYQGPQGSCSCDGQGGVQCLAGSQWINHHWVNAHRGVTLAANVRTLTIEAQRGLVTPTATVSLSTASGARTAQVVALTGRVRSCGDSGLGSPACAL